MTVLLWLNLVAVAILVGFDVFAVTRVRAQRDKALDLLKQAEGTLHKNIKDVGVFFAAHAYWIQFREHAMAVLNDSRYQGTVNRVVLDHIWEAEKALRMIAAYETALVFPLRDCACGAQFKPDLKYLDFCDACIIKGGV